GRRGDRGSGVLGGDQIRNLIGDAAVILRAEKALGAQQIVVEKFRVRKGTADVYEEFDHFGVVERTPGGQRDLKRAESGFVGVSDPFTHDGRGESDHADLGKDVFAVRLLAEDLDDALEPRRVDGITFAGGTENIEIVEALRESVADLLAK